MKNILVPVDFSEPAKHAARYAMCLAEHLNAERIILYNAYQQPMPADPLLIEPTMNAMEVFNVSDLGEISRDHLQRFKKEIQSDAPASLQIEVIGEFNELTEGIQEICKAHQIDLVVTGITVGDKFTETLVGSHALDIAKQVTTPVLVVPQEAGYKLIQNILFACDYKQVAKTTPVLPLQKIITETGANLHVIHVKETDKKEEALAAGSATLKQLLGNISLQFHEVQNSNFAEAINTFVAQHDINLLVAIPKKHGFFDGLFRKSHIKTLAFHTHVPLLLMHEY